MTIYMLAEEVSSALENTSASSGNDLGATMASIGNKLVPNLLSFVVQFLSFLVLLLVVFFVAYKPVKRLLNKRADFIENEVKEAANNKSLALKEHETAKQIVASSKKEASDIIKAAELKGQEKYDAIVLEAKKEADNIKLEAEKDIERAKEEAVEEIRNQIVEVALTTSSEILKREVDNKDNENLAKEFINNLN